LPKEKKKKPGLGVSHPITIYNIEVKTPYVARITHCRKMHKAQSQKEEIGLITEREEVPIGRCDQHPQTHRPVFPFEGHPVG